MRAYHFAIIASVQDGIPLATHLPFVIEERHDELVLVSHLSKANEQWKTFSEKDVLVIFSEPHAYISPSLYEKQKEVPTWNYVSVHAYGRITFIHEPEKQFELLEKMMRSFEPSYMEQWKTLDEKYKEGLRKGIVAFEVTVTKIQAKEKLSQNKSQQDRLNVKNHLLESEDEMKRTLGGMMPE